MSVDPNEGGIVVDTDVVSFLLKGDSRAAPYRRRLNGRLLVVSFMTLAELERWMLRRDWGAARRAHLERFLGLLTVRGVDRTLCRIWAEVTDGAHRAGRPIGVADAWIAATALSLGAPLVTNNARHYAGVPDLLVISES